MHWSWAAEGGIMVVMIGYRKNQEGACNSDVMGQMSRERKDKKIGKISKRHVFMVPL